MSSIPLMLNVMRCLTWSIFLTLGTKCQISQKCLYWCNSNFVLCNLLAEYRGVSKEEGSEVRPPPSPEYTTNCNSNKIPKKTRTVSEIMRFSCEPKWHLRGSYARRRYNNILLTSSERVILTSQYCSLFASSTSAPLPRWQNKLSSRLVRQWAPFRVFLWWNVDMERVTPTSYRRPIVCYRYHTPITRSLDFLVDRWWHHRKFSVRGCGTMSLMTNSGRWPGLVIGVKR